MADLYRVLGARKNASAKALQKAFRAAVKRAHPDMGGSREQFDLVRLAWEVLSDPGRREHYDQTGEYAERQPDKSFNEVFEILVGASAAVINEGVKRCLNLTQEDMVKHIREAIQQRLAEIDKETARLNRTAKALKQLTGRFTTKDKEEVNWLEQAVQHHQRNADMALERLGKETERHNKALELLGKFSFRMDPKAKFGGWGAATSTTRQAYILTQV